MNERIRELWRQAVLNNTKTPMNFQDAADEFALLIIRECRDIVDATRDQAIEDGWNVDEAMSTAMFDIEDHFGV